MFGGFSAQKLKPRKLQRTVIMTTEGLPLAVVTVDGYSRESRARLIVCRSLILFILSPISCLYYTPTELKMAVSRIQIASNKKSALLKQNMREVAVMLAENPPKEEKAKIRAEALIRDDNLIEAYEILQLECELLHERIKLIEYSKTCPPDLVSVVSTLMWAAHRVDIPELMTIRKLFRAKYGKQFEEDALRNADGVLNERVVTKLSVQPPAAYLVQTYLERICEQFEVDWTPAVKLSTNEMIEPMAAPVGYSVQIAQGTGLGTSISGAPETVTGQTANSGVNSKQSEPGIPPPVVTAKPYVPNQNGMGGENNADFEEVDIFVPGAPSAPPGSTTGPNTNNTDSKGGNDDGGGGGGPTASGTESATSYEDLAARFNQLKK